jgi:hypothetical protein
MDMAQRLTSGRRSLEARAASALLAASCLAALLPKAARADAAATSVWLNLDGSVLVLKLAHDEGGRSDGGILSINPATRVVTWRGIDGDLGCKDSFDAPFDKVRAVRTTKPLGFTLSIRDRKSMILVPVVDADWFKREYHVTEGNAAFNNAIKEGAIKMPSSRGEGASVNPLGTNGDAAFGGFKLQEAEIPDEVKADARLAVDSILETMGRTPAPGLRVREALYGSPEDVDVGELSGQPASFEGLAVRVRGKVEGSESSFRLASADASVAVVPSHEVDAAFRAAVSSGNVPELELTGVFRQPAPLTPGGESPSIAGGSVTFWDFIPVNTEPTSGPETVSLDRLVNEPKTFEGKSVRIVGKFRGNNLFTDLPSASWKNMSDFVVKEDATAIWVTGLKPEGKGWRLDVQSPGDTQKWVEVIGHPTLHKGIVYFRASKVSVTTPPSGHAGVTEIRRFAGAARIKPEVVFALPLAGEPVARKGLFVLQFSKTLDAASLTDRVGLRYLDSDHEFRHMNVSYDQDRRALVIDPGELLEVGRQIEVFLKKGITDSDGLTLEASGAPDEAVYTIRYKVVPTAAGPAGS